MSRERKRWLEPSEASKEVMRKRVEQLRPLPKLLGTLLFGTDDAAERVLSAIGEDVQNQVAAGNLRAGAIDTTGEPVSDEIEVCERAVLCADCGRQEFVPAEESEDDSVMALQARGWRVRLSGGLRCPGCAEKGSRRG
jgi:hypothetical protein